MVTQSRLKELIHYNPETGVLTHKTNTTHKRVGDRAGFVHKHKGYRHVCVDGVEYKEHRIIFLYMKGYMPEEVDHIDRVKDNNKWNNLREATRSLNCTNQDIRKDNITGVRGLSYDAGNKFSKWIVRIQRNKKKLHKSFRTKEEAIDFLQGNCNVRVHSR